MLSRALLCLESLEYTEEGSEHSQLGGCRTLTLHHLCGEHHAGSVMPWHPVILIMQTLGSDTMKVAACDLSGPHPGYDTPRTQL